ncbi:alpha-amylase family glycosyl hydrolase [Paenibacillus xanthanilyticus]|uniref:Alpha-amylase n=1 Tax=Paenibacillus xanthanilyticus TaxID=1783531 RepID=A0ABV8K389_9BACL
MRVKGIYTRAWIGAALSAALLLAAVGCASDNNGGKTGNGEQAAANADKAGNDAKNGQAAVQTAAIDEQPSSVYYEIFVRSFYDTNGDGIGDLNGVTQKLDYLKDLGVEGIWLMPINSSPSYHGYDVTDYYSVNPEYGTMDDLKNMLDEAHERGIKVIMDLVVNHTSKEHPWFKEAAADPNSPYRNWYTFKDASEQLPGDGATGGNPWHSAGSYKYLGVFWEGMPDLNFDEPAVRAEMIKAGQYWLDQGLDGFRLDAAKHIYGDFKSSINTPDIQKKNQAWWQEFRAAMTEKKKDAYLIGEVWDSPVIVAPYLEKALDSGFNFDLATKLLDAASTETNPDVAFSLDRVYGMYEKASGGAFVDATFLGNHDLNRTMSVLQGNVDRAKMAAALQLTLPGNPFIYYGEEIGMQGMKPDEAIREPMPWYAAKEGGEGQTKWETSRYWKEGANVETQLKDENSLLAFYKELIAWRKELPALRNGGIKEYKIDNPQIGSYLRVTADDQALVVHNMGGAEQTVQLTEGEFAEIAKQSKDGAKLDGATLVLPAYSTVVLQ